MFRRIALFTLLIIVFGAWHKVAGSQVPAIVKQEPCDRVKEKTRITLTYTSSELNLSAGQNKLLKNIYDHISFVTMLGGIKDKKAAFREVACALKPGGVLSVSEIIFDDHFQTQDTVRQLAQQVGLQEDACRGRPYAYTLDFKKLDSY